MQNNFPGTTEKAGVNTNLQISRTKTKQKKKSILAHDCNTWSWFIIYFVAVFSEPRSDQG